MTCRIQVLLSSFNGEAYITEQLTSILNQKDVDLDLLIRDDGSSDNTINLIKEVNSKHITIVYGQNLGAVRSFFELISLAGDYDYFAFSDQDDFWLDDKLKVAVSQLLPYNNLPAIYSSNPRLVDNELNTIADENRNPRISLKSAIIRNYATGCTVVINRKLMQLLKKDVPKVRIYHDWWANLTALAVGGVSVFDDTPHVLYRQHPNNAVGATISLLEKIYRRIRRLRQNGKYNRDKIASELLRIYKDLIPENEAEFLKLIADYKNHKTKLLMMDGLTSNNNEIDFFFKVSIILNLL